MVLGRRRERSRSRSVTRGTNEGTAAAAAPPPPPSSGRRSTSSTSKTSNTSNYNSSNDAPPSPRRNTSSNKKSTGDIIMVNATNRNGRTAIKRTTNSNRPRSVSCDKSAGGSSSGSGNQDISFVPPPGFAGGNNNTTTRSRLPEKEVDFFANPTTLSRLIHNQKFSGAIARLEKQGPLEAAVWVCTKRKLPPDLQLTDIRGASSTDARSVASANNNDNYCGNKNNNNNKDGWTFRQLPIHMACSSLFRVTEGENQQRQDLEQLIARLVIAHPDGCSKQDHMGRYPLHECVWYNAAPPIISALLMAAPDVARLSDVQGVTPAILNEHRQSSHPNHAQHKKMVRGMLKKSTDFWKTARAEAELRMKHREIPGSDVSITSTSVLASSVADEETIVTKGAAPSTKRVVSSATRHQRHPSTMSSSSSDPSSSRRQHQQSGQRQQEQQQQEQARQQLMHEVRQNQPTPESAPAKPLEWVQLEKRAAALEQKLSECYEHIYMLNQQLNELKGAKQSLQAKVNKFLGQDAGQRIAALEQERDELQFHLARSQAVLAKHGISLEEENEAEGMPPLPPLQISYTTTSSSPALTENTAETTKGDDEDDNNNDNGILDSVQDDNIDYDLALDQQKLAKLKEQLDALNQDHAGYQDRLQYYGDIHITTNKGYGVLDDGMTARSEITSDDFTAMTPVSKFMPQRPGPDGDASLVGGGGGFSFNPRALAVQQQQQSREQRTPSSQSPASTRRGAAPGSPSSLSQAQRMPAPPRSMGAGVPVETVGDRHAPLASAAPVPADPAVVVKTRGGDGGSAVGGDVSELDSVILGAMELNGGHGLSPELIALWKGTSTPGSTSLASISGYTKNGAGYASVPSMASIAEGDGMMATVTENPKDISSEEEHAMFMRLQARPAGADDSSSYLPPPPATGARPSSDDSSLLAPPGGGGGGQCDWPAQRDVLPPRTRNRVVLRS